jgi:hypothetical protein
MRRSSTRWNRRRTAPLSAVLAAALALLLPAACTGGPDRTAEADGLTVGVKTHPSPAELGEQEFVFQVEADGRPVSDATVAFRMFMPGMPMSTDDVWHPASPTGKGRYAGRGDFSMGGSWIVSVSVGRPDREPVGVRFPFEIKWELK